MRILHTTQYFMPWIGYQELYLAREQLRAEHEVLVVSSNLRWPGGTYAALRSCGLPREMPVGHSVESGVPTLRLPVRLERKGRLLLPGVIDEIRRFRPDVVHAHILLVPLTFQVAAARRRMNFRLLIDEHQLPNQSNLSLGHRLLRRITALAVRTYVLPVTDHLVAVAGGARSWTAKEYGWPEEQIQYIPLGADTDVFHPDPQLGQTVRVDHGIAPHEQLVVYSGKIVAAKRVDLLIEAIAAMGPERPTLLAIGSAEPSDLAVLRALASKRGVRFVVAPPVPPERLAGFFNAADICAWPADCTISHLEAAACGRPIVIPDDPGIVERVANQNGIAVRTGDVASLRSALMHLFDDRNLRERMGRAGRHWMEADASWTAIARRFEALYRGDSTVNTNRPGTVLTPGEMNHGHTF